MKNRVIWDLMNASIWHYFILYKPYRILSGFTGEGSQQTLASLTVFPKDVYPVGRLDQDSEGLLLLTNDKTLNHRLLSPGNRHEREYWVQVEGDITAGALAQLRNGLPIRLDGIPYLTKPCQAERFRYPPEVPARIPPVRTRMQIPDSWIRLVLQEGKNRQIRRMAAATGFPVLRIIRYRIAGITLAGMLPGELKELNRDEFYQSLFVP